MSNKKVATVWIAFIVSIGFLFIGIAGGQTQLPSISAAKIDLNKATAEQLAKFPGLNSSLARGIVEYRDKSGPFKTPEDLLKVKGITKEILNKIGLKMEKGILYVTPSSNDDEEEPSLKPSKC
jgi:competence ComEA-like helix-hairpin-helix protein